MYPTIFAEANSAKLTVAQCFYVNRCLSVHSFEGIILFIAYDFEDMMLLITYDFEGYGCHGSLNMLQFAQKQSEECLYVFKT